MLLSALSSSMSLNLNILSSQLDDFAPVPDPAKGRRRQALRFLKLPPIRVRNTAAGHAAADFPEAVRPAQLEKPHGHELRPAGEAPGVALGSALSGQLLELDPRKKLEKLAEDAAKLIHG